MRDYAEDPVFRALSAPTTFAARRRTILVLVSHGGTIERLSLGGGTQGGVFEARRSTEAPAGPAGGRTERHRELWGDEQWIKLRSIVEEVKPQAIGVDVSRVSAFSDGLTAGELEAMSEALGPWASRLKRVEDLAVDLIAWRSPAEEQMFARMNELTWQIISTAFSGEVIEPGRTRTSDVVWWMRQRVNDLGLGTWFHPSVELQRRGASEREVGEDPVIQKGDLLHCDFGITALRLNTDTQHMAYVLQDGESAPPAGLTAALRASNRLQDIVLAEIRPGRSGNEILASSIQRMRAEGIDGTIYAHPIGLHGHGAGPIIGLWDHQEGVPGRGDHKVIANMWFSIELQATSAVPEWGGQRVRSAQEEDAVVGSDGSVRWAFQRQSALHLVR
jgi:Xaa-Pro aminopeptidase